MLPTLPRLDPDPRGRAERLAASRDELTYAHDRPEGVAMAASLPRRLGFPLGVLAQVAAAEASLLANRAALRLREGLLRPHPEDAPSSIASCTELFATLPAPPIARLIGGGSSELADRAFAWQRVAGACPLVLRRVARVPDALPLEDARYRAVIGGDSLAAAAAEGRLFAADYALLEGLPAGRGGGAPKFVCAPIALFARAPGGRALLPIAIQCAQTPGPDAPVLTPRDGVAWQMAKVAVQVADANVQESFFHLGRAHFLIEAFALALERQISERHPLHALLAPHFHGTLAINGAARDKLVVAGGQLEELLAPTLDGSLALVRRALSSFRLDEASLEADLGARGVGDREVLPEYPYRDDARLIAGAIDAWAAGYLRLAYPSDDEVRGDLELAAFVAELRSERGGRLRGMPERVETVDALAKLVSFVIFTASAFHGALNYTQGDFMGWVPNMPTSGYAPPGAAFEDETAAWSAVLPRSALATKQLEFMLQQSNVRDGRLGEYGPGHFRDPRVAEPLSRFRAALESARRVIESRDAERLLPYPYLRPDNLTGSIHI